MIVNGCCKWKLFVIARMVRCLLVNRNMSSISYVSITYHSVMQFLGHVPIPLQHKQFKKRISKVRLSSVMRKVSNGTNPSLVHYCMSLSIQELTLPSSPIVSPALIITHNLIILPQLNEYFRILVALVTLLLSTQVHQQVKHQPIPR